MKIIGDYHTHSQYSHGKGDIRKNVQIAVEKGLKEIAITDHGPRAYSVVPLGVRRPEKILDIKKEIEEVNKEFPQINVLCGIEANIINHDGDLDIPESILEQLDIIAAGLHLLIIPPDIITARKLIIDNKIVYKLFPGRRKEIRRWNTEAVINAVQKYPIDFITHPGYQLDINTYALANACAKEDTYLEINARHGNLTTGFVRAASKTPVKFIINSDAHSPENVGSIEPGIRIAKKLGLENNRLVNVIY